MTANVRRRRPDPDPATHELLVDIAEYAGSFQITSDLAYETAPTV
jgi:hypothetical protein